MSYILAPLQGAPCSTWTQGFRTWLIWNHMSDPPCLAIHQHIDQRNWLGWGVRRNVAHGMEERGDVKGHVCLATGYHHDGLVLRFHQEIFPSFSQIWQTKNPNSHKYINMIWRSCSAPENPAIMRAYSVDPHRISPAIEKWHGMRYVMGRLWWRFTMPDLRKIRICAPYFVENKWRFVCCTRVYL